MPSFVVELELSYDADDDIDIRDVADDMGIPEGLSIREVLRQIVIAELTSNLQYNGIPVSCTLR